MTHRWLSTTDPSWADALQRLPHDVYDLPTYLEVAADQNRSTPLAYHAWEGDAEMLVPLLVSPIPAHLGALAGQFDATSPYGYPSARMTPGIDAATAASLIEGFRVQAAKIGIVSFFLRFHPLLENHHDAWARVGTIVEEGTTVHIDLTQTTEQMWQNTSRPHRRGIEELLAAGYEARIDEWAHYADFIRAYRAKMTRVAATDAYLLSDAYFEDVRAKLAEHVHLCAVVAPDGGFAAGGLFFATRGIVQHHLAATVDAYREDAPSKLVIHHGRAWAKQAGHRVFHIGGGVGARDDSLLQFKKGFSKSRATYTTGRIIIDEFAYARLVHARTILGSNLGGHFFPLYRHPVPPPAPLTCPEPAALSLT